MLNIPGNILHSEEILVIYLNNARQGFDGHYCKGRANVTVVKPLQEFGKLDKCLSRYGRASSLIMKSKLYFPVMSIAKYFRYFRGSYLSA